MRRTIIVLVVLGLAIAGIAPITATAKPTPYKQDVQDRGGYVLGPGEIPYYTKSMPSYPTRLTSMPGKRTVATSVASEGSSIELNAWTATGLGLVALFVIGLGTSVAIWHNRSRLSPA